MINIFNTIGKVTSRIEPFHSEFLASAIHEEKKLFSNFIKLIFTNQNEDLAAIFLKSGQVKIKSEDSFFDFKRIDIIIKEPQSKNIIGVEVKTNDSSVQSDQLLFYREKMVEKYPEYNIFMVYVTPFNHTNLPKVVSPNQVFAIREFHLFNEKYPNSTHINWDEIVEQYDEELLTNQNLFLQHKQYIQAKVTNKSRLIARISNVERNRGLAEFFGEECLSLFYERLKGSEIVYSDDDQKIVFNISENRNNFPALLDSFKVLMESEEWNKLVTKTDEVEEDLLREYKNGNNSDFYNQFFSVVGNYKYLWMKGQGKIGIRAAHKSHSSGVSIFTIDRNNVIIRKKR